MKTCNHCKRSFGYESLVKNKKMRDGYKNECKECHNRLEKERYHSKPKNERYSRYRQVKKTYGLSKEEYDILLKSANYCCQICKGKKRLCVDHCHSTGKVRGILCGNCNSGIGKLGDNKEMVLKAYSYLSTYDFWSKRLGI
jgi:hypothetical protein